MNKKVKTADLLKDKRAVDAPIALSCVKNLSLKKLRTKCHLTLNAKLMIRLTSRSGLTAPRVLPLARRQKAILIWN